MATDYGTESFSRIVLDHAKRHDSEKELRDFIADVQRDLGNQFALFPDGENHKFYLDGANSACSKILALIQSGFHTDERLYRLEKSALNQHRKLRGVDDKRSAYYQGVKDICRAASVALSNIEGDSKESKERFALMDESFYDHYEAHKPVLPSSSRFKYPASPVLPTVEQVEYVKRTRLTFSVAEREKTRKAFPQYAKVVQEVSERILGFRRQNKNSVCLVFMPSDTAEIIMRIDNSRSTINYFAFIDTMNGGGRTALAGINAACGRVVALVPEIPVSNRYAMNFIAKRFFIMMVGKWNADRPVGIFWVDFDPDIMQDGEDYLESSGYRVSVFTINERKSW